MPQVPYDPNNSIAPTGQATPYQNINATPAAFGGAVDQAIEGLGAAGGRASDEEAKHILVMQGLANETLAKDADNNTTRALDELMYDPNGGYFTKYGKDAVDGFKPALEAAQKLREEAKANLPNPMAQKMFDDTFVRRLDYMMTNMSQHAATENKKWMQQTSVARIETAVASSALRPDDKEYFDKTIGIIKSEVHQQGELFGQSEDTVRANTQKQLSEAWDTRIRSLANTDPRLAQDLFRDNIDQIVGDKSVVLAKHLEEMVKPLASRDLSRNIMNGGGIADVDKLTQAVIHQESGGNQAAVSSAGAIGIMQVMPDTARMVAQEMNIPFDMNRLKTDKAYNLALGKRYLQDMTTRYGGNQTLALAAYNAGPGNVDSWLKKYGNPNEGTISNEAFIEKIPLAETKNYVTSINAKVALTPGSPPTSSDVKQHEAEWEAQGRAAAEQQRPNDPVYADMVVTHIKAYASQVMEGDRLAEQHTKNTLLTAVTGNGDPSKGATTLPDLLSSPDLKAAWAKSTPETQLAVMKIVKSNAAGAAAKTSPEALQTYYGALGLMSTDPEAGRKLNLTKVVGEIPNNLLLDLMHRQASLNAQGRVDTNKQLNWNTYMKVAEPILSSAGFDISTKAKTEPTMQTFIGQFQHQIDDFTAQNKRAPTNQDIRDITSNLIAVNKTDSWFTRDVRYFEAVPDSKERPKVIQGFMKQNNGRTPTEDQIKALYVRTLLSKRK